MSKVFVGLGEGIGNVIMGLPLVDALHDGGHEVFLDLLPTPPEIRHDLWQLVVRGRRWIRSPDLQEVDRYDAACLTHWWTTLATKLPPADVLYFGDPPSDSPEILANLKAAGPLINQSVKSTPAVLAPGWKFKPQPDGLRLHVGIHPGCKPHPVWNAMKVYPRWAEVTHRLKALGAVVLIFGTPTDDAYCGEPSSDYRQCPRTLNGLSREMRRVDCLVSGDSGLHHMAVALGVPTVALFGQSSVAKATHPNPIVRPVIFGPGFDSIDPRAVAKAAFAAASKVVSKDRIRITTRRRWLD